MSNLANWIERWADFRPNHCAIHFEGTDISYRALDAMVRRCARALEHELEINPGDRVAYLGYNRPEMLALLFACARLGAIFLPLNWRLAPPEHRYILDHSGARALIVEPEFVGQSTPLLDSLPDLRPFVLSTVQTPGQASEQAPEQTPMPWQSFDAVLSKATGDATRHWDDLSAPVLLVYTSGTTGRPKGAVLTQNALFYNAVNSVHAHDLTSADHVLTMLPMFHVGGLNIQTLPALHAGARVTLQRRFVPDDFFAALAARRPSITVLVPAVMLALQQHPSWSAADLSCLRLINAGSSTIPDALIRPFHERGVPVCQVYGSTETAPIAVFLRAEDAMAHIGSTGKPAVHCRMRIVDNDGNDVPTGGRGEILISGPNVTIGYWRDDDATRAAFSGPWFHTGDIGHVDAEGYLYVDDRKKDLIISGGENIYPAEVENVLAECPDLAEWSVVGRPDPRWGEVAVAVVVLKPGRQQSRDSIKALFQGRLARYKHPHDVVFMEQLPRNAMGKILKFALRDQLAATKATH